MKSALVAIAASALASVASAQMLFYGYPIQGTTWDLSKPETLYVQWTNDCKNLTDGTQFDINLNVQSPAGVQVPVPTAPGPIGTLDCKAKGKISVTVPDAVPSGSQYSILVLNGAEKSYSALFTINNPKIPAANTTTVTAPPSAAATSSTVATATSSAANKTTASATVSAKPTATSPSAAGALKVGSTAALVVVAAVGLML